MSAPNLTAASEIQRIAANDWPLAVEFAHGLGLVADVDLELAYATGVDVLELTGLVPAGIR